MGKRDVAALAGLLLLASSLAWECGSSVGEFRAAGDTVFAESFESGELGAWNDGVDPLRQHVVEDARAAQSGTHYLEITYPAGSDGGWLTRFLPAEFDSLYVSVWVEFFPGWTGDTKLVALYGSRSDNRWSAFGQAGKCPNGSDFFATMVVTDQQPQTQSGVMRFYTYYPGMATEPDGVTCWGRFGDGTERYAPAPLATGLWHHIEFCVRLNDPGQANASQALWVDGTARGLWSGFALRASDVLTLNALQLTFSRALGGSPAPPATHLALDNLVVRRTLPDHCHVNHF